MADGTPTSEPKRIINFEQVKHTLVTPTALIGLALLLFTWSVIAALGWYFFQQHQTLKQQVAVLASKPAPVAVGNVDIAPLEQRLSFLEDQMTQLSMQAAQRPVLQPEVRGEEKPQAPSIEVEKAIGTLQTQLADTQQTLQQMLKSHDNAAVLVAVISLREAVDNGSPYIRELSTLALLTKDDETVQTYLKTLRPFAENGVATPSLLKSTFPDAIASVLKASQAEQEEKGVKGWMKNQLADVVQVRRVGGDVEGQSTEAILARAEHAVAQSKFAAALKELQTLQGKPLEAVQAWIEQATAYHNANSAADSAYRYILTPRTTGQNP